MTMIEPDLWLGNCLGYPAFKVTQRGDVMLLRKQVIDLACPALYYVKIPTDQVSLLHEFCQIGFRVVNVNVTLVRQAKAIAYLRGSNVLSPWPDDYSRLLEIAGGFVCSRFHLDPLISRETADAIKRVWLGNYLTEERGEKLFVAFNRGEPVGFLAVIEESWGEGQVKTIDLIAVHPDEQRKGIARQLVSHFLATYPRWDTKVGTQVANIASLRLYAAMGFLMVQSEYVLHLHSTGRVGDHTLGVRSENSQAAGTLWGSRRAQSQWLSLD